MVEKDIDDKKQYEFPQNIKIVKYKKIFIVIAVDFANWIILKSKAQLDFFYELALYPLNIALDKTSCPKDDAIDVICQIEARNFERKEAITVSEKRSLP